MKEKIILVTGAAGFIGFHLCKRLLEQGCRVIGLDNLNGYYSVQLKLDRLKQLGVTEVIEGELVSGEKFKEDFQFIKLDLENRSELSQLFEKFKFTSVCNLAAQAGVRYSIENPNVYIDSNIVGFANLLECMRHANVKKLVYASSSSVYGNAKKTPFETADTVDEPISLYAATKKSNELMAHTYSHLYDIQTIGLRFFTVYGPWGRPDMAMFLFTDAILKGKSIKVFNNGNLSRDFTYIDDIINGLEKILLMPPPHKKKYCLYNIGNGKPVKLMNFIEAIEQVTETRAKKEFLPMQPGDVEQTWADTTALENDYNYKPNTNVEYGIQQFVNWHKEYYNINK